MDQACDFLDVRNGPCDIRSMRTGHEPRLLRQQSLQLIDRAVRVLAIRSTPPFHLQARPLRNPQPSGAVGLMVQLGQNQLVARPELKGR